MSFIQQTIDQNLDVWEQCYRTPFVEEISKGVLPHEKFRNYIIQDSIYLKQYARVYARAIYIAPTLKDIQMFYSGLSFVTDGESVVRLNYLTNIGINDDEIEQIEPWAENKKYTDFMLKICDNYGIPEILMAVLPCMMGYCYVMLKALENYGDISQSKYRDLIEDYTSKEYINSCEIWGKYTDEICKNLPQSRKKVLAQIFREASLHELYFWEMVYREVGE